MNEKIISFGEENQLNGILTEPIEYKKNLPCIILLNAGIVHKVGPHRTYTNIVRELATKGLYSLRFDFSGIGDSQVNRKDHNLIESWINDSILAMDKVQEMLKIEWFIFYGFCNGADIALRTAAIDDRIKAVISVNGLIKGRENNSFDNIYLPIAKRILTLRYYRKNILNLNKWINVFRGKSNFQNVFTLKAIFRIIGNIFRKMTRRLDRKVKSINEPGKPKLENNSVMKIWCELLSKEIEILMLFSEGSEITEVFNFTVLNELKHHDKNKKIQVFTFKNIDHTFTPIWSQNKLSDFISEWILTNKRKYLK